MKISKSNSEKIEFYQTSNEGDTLIVKPILQLTYSDVGGFRLIFDDLPEYQNIKKIVVDFSNQMEFDTYLIVFREFVENYCITNNIEYSEINLSDDIDSMISLMKSQPADLAAPKKELSVLRKQMTGVGNSVLNIFQDIFNFISFFGEVFIKFFILIFHPSRMRWQDMPTHFTQSGVLALPITVMIVFLLGLITGYQGALQLKQFGADMFIANLVGISLTRELSPLMVAILVAGRSGSAFAAEIGSMKVSEEIDALTTMGFDKLEFLVLPRVLAVTLAMPFLVIICNVIGMIGGMIAAITTLDITISGYIGTMQSALTLWDIGTGVFKSIIFGSLIAMLGCYKGLNVKGGADAVGRYTTASVVAGVFLIILSDAVFTFIFQALGI